MLRHVAGPNFEVHDTNLNNFDRVLLRRERNPIFDSDFRTRDSF
jgi:hypothetical protein